MRRTNRKTPIGLWIGLGALAFSGAYIAYKCLNSNVQEGGSSNDDNKSERKNKASSSSSGSAIVKPTTKVAIVISKALIDQGMPVQQLLELYPELVVILIPEVLKSKQHFNNVDSQVPLNQKFRIIPCETSIGIVHVIKHLRPHLAILPSDISKNTPSDINRFVGAVTVLSRDIAVANEEIHGLFFKGRN